MKVEVMVTPDLYSTVTADYLFVDEGILRLYTEERNMDRGSVRRTEVAAFKQWYCYQIKEDE